ncbi:MAG: hypothetical protein KDC71_15850 [Acidobacteria bacterium]|nr:hypothetical protein [Acidobacteriota bacterium]
MFNQAFDRWIKALGTVLLLSGLYLSAGDDVKYQQNKSCLECHDGEVDPLHRTIHIPAFGVSCQDCHVDYKAHMEDEDTKPSSPVGASANEVCLSCHNTTHQPKFGGDVHAQNSVYCMDCHQSHKKDAQDVPILSDQQDQLCLSCHTDQRVQFSKPYTHTLGQGGMTCSSCHNPHGGAGQASLASAHNGKSACSSCHVEKEGPFVFDHVNGTTGDCMSCHEPHGSSNPRQLNRARVNQVCFECHSALPAGTLGSQPPSFHDMRSNRYQDCTVCHTAVHGSSQSPALLK